MNPADGASHLRFSQRYGFRFPLLVDGDGQLIPYDAALHETSVSGQAETGARYNNRVPRLFARVRPATPPRPEARCRSIVSGLLQARGRAREPRTRWGAAARPPDHPRRGLPSQHARGLAPTHPDPTPNHRRTPSAIIQGGGFESRRQFRAASFAPLVSRRQMLTLAA